MRRTLLLLTTMVVALLLASGVALAVNKVGTNGPDTLRGTNGDDNLLDVCCQVHAHNSLMRP
jgi:hypothetical protein